MAGWFDCTPAGVEAVLTVLKGRMTSDDGFDILVSKRGPPASLSACVPGAVTRPPPTPPPGAQAIVEDAEDKTKHMLWTQVKYRTCRTIPASEIYKVRPCLCKAALALKVCVTHCRLTRGCFACFIKGGKKPYCLYSTLLSLAVRRRVPPSRQPMTGSCVNETATAGGGGGLGRSPLSANLPHSMRSFRLELTGSAQTLQITA